MANLLRCFFCRSRRPRGEGESHLDTCQPTTDVEAEEAAFLPAAEPPRRVPLARTPRQLLGGRGEGCHVAASRSVGARWSGHVAWEAEGGHSFDPSSEESFHHLGLGASQTHSQKGEGEGEGEGEASSLMMMRRQRGGAMAAMFSPARTKSSDEFESCATSSQTATETEDSLGESHGGDFGYTWEPDEEGEADTWTNAGPKMAPNVAEGGGPGWVKSAEKEAPKVATSNPISSDLKPKKLADVITGCGLRAVDFGPSGSLRYRLLFADVSGAPKSPWHDVPLHAPSGALRFLCKTPAATWQHLEVATEEPLAPLRLKRSKSQRGGPTHYAENVPWNFGFFPQTAAQGVLGFRGDALPVEAVEIGTRVARVGEVYGVKVLAAMAVVEGGGGEASWKVVVIAEDDAMAPLLGGLRDVSVFFPDTLERLRDWLQTRNCVHPEDRESGIGFNGQAKDEVVAMEVVHAAHAAWRHVAADYRKRTSSSAPISISEYESDTWQQLAAAEPNEETIPLCELAKISAFRYERAWLRSSRDDSDSSLSLSLSSSFNASGSSSPALSEGAMGSPARRMLQSFLHRNRKKGTEGGEDGEETAPAPSPSPSPAPPRKGLRSGEIWRGAPIEPKKQSGGSLSLPSPKRFTFGHTRSLDEETIKKIRVCRSPASAVFASGRTWGGSKGTFERQLSFTEGKERGGNGRKAGGAKAPSQIVAEWHELCATAKKEAEGEEKEGEGEGEGEGGGGGGGGARGRKYFEQKRNVSEEERRITASLIKLASEMAKGGKQQISVEELLRPTACVGGA